MTSVIDAVPCLDIASALGAGPHIPARSIRVAGVTLGWVPLPPRVKDVRHIPDTAGIGVARSGAGRECPERAELAAIKKKEFAMAHRAGMFGELSVLSDEDPSCEPFESRLGLARLCKEAGNLTPVKAAPGHCAHDSHYSTASA